MMSNIRGIYLDFTKGEAEMSPSHFWQWLIKTNIPQFQQAEVLVCCFSWSASMVDLFYLVWQSHQIVVKKPDGWPPFSMPGRNCGWISRSGRLLSSASTSLGNGKVHAAPGEGISNCLLMESDPAQSSKVSPHVGRCHKYKYLLNGTTMTDPEWL